MADSPRSQNLKALWSDPKKKMNIIMTAVVLALGCGFGYVLINRAPAPQLRPDIKLSGAPDLNSVPGATNNPKYADAAKQANDSKFESAEKTGGSALPVPVKLEDGAKTLGMNDSSVGTTSIGSPFGAQAQAQTPVQQTQAPLPYQQQQIPQVNTTAPVQYAQTIPQAPQNLGRQLDVLLDRWAPTGHNMETDYTGAKAKTASAMGGDMPNVSLVSGQGATTNNATGTLSAAPLIRAGTIYSAILKTGVNTDEPGPVLAELVSGPYRGATMIGQLVSSGNQRAETVALQFTLLNSTAADRSIPIQAYAINPDTSRTGMATSVDKHYLERFGLIFASSFISGYGQAVAQSGSTVTNNPLGGTTVSTPTRTPEQLNKIALGSVGQAVGQEMIQNARMPTTIKVNQGTSIGVLIMQDVSAIVGK